MTTLMPGRRAGAAGKKSQSCPQRARLATAAAIAAGPNDMLSELVEEQAALRRVATLVARGASSTEVFSAVADEMARCLHVSHGAVVSYEPDGSGTVAASYEAPGFALWRVGERMRLDGDNVASRVLRARCTVRMDSHENAPGSASVRVREVGLNCGVGAPIMVDGRLWGAAIVACAEPLPADTEARMSDFADLVATAIAAATNRAELNASRARIVAASDEARRRLERDLHDGAQQRLVSLGLQLRMVEASIPAELAGLREQLSDIVSGLTAVSDDVREISHGIHPAILSSGGLGPALKTLAHRSALPVVVDVAIDHRLPESAEVGAYYVVAEALTNAAKHAQASEAEVSAHADDTLLYVSVADNGIGGADSRNGGGLIGLTDRVEALGGHLRMVSPPGKGTHLDVTIPID